MAADLQREARALGDPTRHRLFRYIADAPAPVGVAELTAYIQLNHNAVRQHLAVLKDAGLVTEDTENRDRPGQPRLLYRLHPEAAGQLGAPTVPTPGWPAFSPVPSAGGRTCARRAGRTGTGAPPNSLAQETPLTCWRRRWSGGGSARPGPGEAGRSARARPLPVRGRRSHRA